MTNKTTFSAGKHQYQITEGGLNYQAPNGAEITLAWPQIQGFKKSLFGSAHFFCGRAGKIPLSYLPVEEQKELLLGVFHRWRKQEPDLAKKAAFDYVDNPKAFASVLLGICLFFALPLAYVQLNDSYELYSCSKALRKTPVLGEMQITKMKRKSDGPYLLNFQYKTLDGKILQGKDQFITADKLPPPTVMPIVYDRENPSCWSLTPSANSQEVNWAKRRFFEAYTLLFGSFFLLSGVAGILWGWARYREKRPFTAELAALFSFE